MRSFHGVPRIRTNPRTAEMIKYASNAFLATAISFSNELANLCAALGQVDAVEVMEGVHASSYLTVHGPDGARAEAPITSFLLPGCGFGGSCLPKDVSALAAHGEEDGRADAAAPVGRRRQPGTARPGAAAPGKALLRPGRAARRRAGPRLQARHRRRPRVARVPRDSASARAAGHGEGLRPGGHAPGAEASSGRRSRTRTRWRRASRRWTPWSSSLDGRSSRRCPPCCAR